jgi:hypothetical protein
MISFGFSLLQPDRDSSAATETMAHLLQTETTRDLGIDALLPHIVRDKKRIDGVRTILTQLCTDRGTVEYRLEILGDLMLCPELVDVLEALIPTLSELRYYVFRPDMQDWTEMQETAFRLRELEQYATCVQTLADGFAEVGDALTSRGFRGLRELVTAVANDETFRNLQRELPELLKAAESPGSITVGVNLTSGMVPGEAVLLSINDKRYGAQGLFGRLVGNSDWHGVAPIHSSSTSETYANPMLVPLFRDLSKLQRKTTAPLAMALRSFVGLNSRLFVSLQDEILFYLGAVDLFRSLSRRGLPVCRPSIRDADDRELSAKGLYNANLALRSDEAIVTNDIELGRAGSTAPRIAVVTGPNSGGKTTFLEAVGLAQVLAQVGLYVPAESASISLCDTVLTHYPALEEVGRSTGRFGEEAERLARLFDSVSRSSLILLNETLSSTAMGESVYIGCDMLRVLRSLGCRAVYVTHLHQLAEEAEAINADTDGDADVISLVATIAASEDGSLQPAYRLVCGPPDGKGYARRLAAEYGIDRIGLLARLQKRTIVPETNHATSR